MSAFLWRQPEWLWLLLVVVAAAGFYAYARMRRQAALEAFAEAHLLPTVAPGHDSRRPLLGAGLVCSALLLLVVALAGPQWGYDWEEIRREGVDIIVALDTSRSMLASDVLPNRIERAKLAVQDLVRQLEGDRIGLVAFAGTAFLQCPLTLDYQAFIESLQAVSVGIIPRGGTSMASAIRTSIDGFEGRAGRHTALVLITDGEDNEGDLDAAIQEAVAAGVRVYTVGVGTPSGELIEIEVDGRREFLKDRRGQVIKSRLDEETLRRIASETGGAYLFARGPSLGLDDLYANHIARMDRRELQSAMQRRYRERFQLPLAAAFLLLAAEPLVRVGRRRRGGSGDTA